MQMPKPTDEDKDRFRSLVPDHEAVEVKPMFGNLGAFVHGNMFAGLFGSAVGVKLDDSGLAELDMIDGVGPFGPAERPMGGYRSLPAHWSDDQAAVWLERALAHVETLPPKVKRPRAKS